MERSIESGFLLNPDLQHFISLSFASHASIGANALRPAFEGEGIVHGRGQVGIPYGSAGVVHGRAPSGATIRCGFLIVFRFK
jgi:hypothetical protein